VPPGTDCGSTCTVSATCDDQGICIGRPAFGCANLGECRARVCDEATNTCVETGAKDGQACGGDPCHVCQHGTCRTTCGPCQSCDPTSGQCRACEPCCGGVCGLESCGDGTCCPPDQSCCKLGAEGRVCWPKDQVCHDICFVTPMYLCNGDCLTTPQYLCNGVCYDTPTYPCNGKCYGTPQYPCEDKCFDHPVTCCGRGLGGGVVTCNLDQTCCPTGFPPVCCNANEVCSAFGCIPSS
jgi:hypothetical protein